MTHTHHTKIHIHLCIFITISLFSASCHCADKQYEDCVPRKCGEKIISFPFFITGLQQPYCGAPDPGFNITCENNTRSLIRVTQEDQYLLVNEIFDDNRSLLVSDAEISNSTESCSNIRQSSRNLTLSSDHFEYMVGSKLVLLKNCSEKEGLDKYRVDCDGDNYLVMNKNDTNLRDAVCETRAELPIQMFDDEIITSRNYWAVLRRGFALKWTATNCRVCKSTGGRCGFDIQNYQFLCFCEDRPHYKSCTASPSPTSGSKGKKRKRIIIVSLILSIGVILVGLSLMIYMFKEKKKKSQLRTEERLRPDTEQFQSSESQQGDLELPLINLLAIEKATNHFSINNMLGEGGFGPVYKGLLDDGKEIAVKRLSKTSRQGTNEFKNEVVCIAKLQHRNLVKLLGCCIQEEEMMLIYEYLPNKGLDFFIFDETRSKLLDWPTRFNIINGIARGLVYLHQDSRLRIIHSDLKVSNILLDKDLNPKISDFGMAKIFGGDETQANTRRVVGTYGYMSPEYQLDGVFSVKSDVFSFGVLVLEIASGKRNRGFFHQDHHHNLLGHIWNLYKEGIPEKVIDGGLSYKGHEWEVVRSIHIGLLCVQQDPEDRPNMSYVVRMLGSDQQVIVTPPKQPGFFHERNRFMSDQENSSSARNISLSCNDMSN